MNLPNPNATPLSKLEQLALHLLGANCRAVALNCTEPRDRVRVVAMLGAYLLAHARCSAKNLKCGAEVDALISGAIEQTAAALTGET